MPRMAVKGVRSPFNILLWYHHCPLCPDWPSVGYPQSGACHDDARKHAEKHRCRECIGMGFIFTNSGYEPLFCFACMGRGWV